MAPAIGGVMDRWPDDYECEGQIEISQCFQCANEGTQYCAACEGGDLHRTQDEKDYEDWMCDLMCGGADESDI